MVQHSKKTVTTLTSNFSSRQDTLLLKLYKLHYHVDKNIFSLHHTCCSSMINHMRSKISKWELNKSRNVLIEDIIQWMIYEVPLAHVTNTCHCQFQSA